LKRKDQLFVLLPKRYIKILPRRAEVFIIKKGGNSIFLGELQISKTSGGKRYILIPREFRKYFQEGETIDVFLKFVEWVKGAKVPFREGGDE